MEEMLEPPIIGMGSMSTEGWKMCAISNNKEEGGDKIGKLAVDNVVYSEQNIELV
jgi:hypothetical protein